MELNGWVIYDKLSYCVFGGYAQEMIILGSTIVWHALSRNQKNWLEIGSVGLASNKMVMETD